MGFMGLKHLKPKGAAGRAAVKRLGRNYKTGNFDKGVKAIEKKGLSSESAQRIMGAQYWEKVRKRKAGNWKATKSGGLRYAD